MRIFVSGATGVVGRRVVPLLLAAGHRVTAVGRSPDAHKHLKSIGATPVQADLFDPSALRTAVDGHDAVINLATHMPSSSVAMLFQQAWRLNSRIRTIGVRNLVDAALACGVSRFIQESFALAYADHGDEWITEDEPLEPARYNATVVDAERSVDRFNQSGGTGVVLRFAAFYGPDAMQMESYIQTLRWGWAGLPGGASCFISSISHDDAASAVVAALNANAGAYNVVDDVPLRREEYFGSLARELKLQPPRFFPPWTAPLFGALGDTLARSLRLSNQKFRAETGWLPKWPSVREAWPLVLAERLQ